MLKLGAQNISGLYVGGIKTKKAYLGGNLVYSASEPPVPVVCTVTLSVSPAGAGTAAGGGTYESGQTVTLTYTAADGYAFTGWQENGTVVSTDNPYTFTAAADRTLTAVFAAVPVSRLPEGYTEVEYIQNSNTSSYIETKKAFTGGQKITLIFSLPNSGKSNKYVFGASYCGLSCGTNNSLTWLGDYISASSNKQYTIYSGNLAEKIMITGEDNALNVNGQTTTMARPIYANQIVFPYKTSSYSQIVRIYYFKGVKETSTSKSYNFELIPCINPSGVVGLYDLTNSAFIAPTAGTFTAGPAV